MRSLTAYGESRLLFWQHVREFAVPPSMIESATTLRTTGDWAGACTAARFDVDLDLRAATHAYGRELAAQVRKDLRRLAPDLLRWHMPRIGSDGLLRPGLTMSLARYRRAEDGDAVHLVARTPPAWADAGQRISLALWDKSRPEDGAGAHPHPRPDRRFRLDLHRHLWDAHRAGELRQRAGKGPWAAESAPTVLRDQAGLVPPGIGCAVDQWASEAAILLRSQGQDSGTVAVRLGAKLRLLLHMNEHGDAADTSVPRISAFPAKRRNPAHPCLPDAATWVLPDLALLRAGLIDADQVHPLVAAALMPGRPQSFAPEAAHSARDPPRRVSWNPAPDRSRGWGAGRAGPRPG